MWLFYHNYPALEGIRSCVVRYNTLEQSSPVSIRYFFPLKTIGVYLKKCSCHSLSFTITTIFIYAKQKHLELHSVSLYEICSNQLGPEDTDTLGVTVISNPNRDFIVSGTSSNSSLIGDITSSSTLLCISNIIESCTVFINNTLSLYILFIKYLYNLPNIIGTISPVAKDCTG